MKIIDYLHLYLFPVGLRAQMPDGTLVVIEGLFQSGANIFANCLIQDATSDLNGVDLSYMACALKPILRPLGDMTEEEMFTVAKMEGYELNHVIVTDDDEPLTNKLLEARFFRAGEPDPQCVFDPIEADCIGFKTQVLHGVKEGIGEVWSEPAWDTFWNWESHLTKDSFRYLLSKHFDLFGLIGKGLAIKTKEAAL